MSAKALWHDFAEVFRPYMGNSGKRQVANRLFVRRAMKTVLYPLRSLISQLLRNRDLRFDQRAGIATSGIVTLAELGLSSATSMRYEPTPVGFFRSLLSKLPVDYPRTTFIDLGAGKGRVLLLASEFPFHKIIGVEISSELVETARHNVKSFHSNVQQCRDIALVCTGIDNYEFEPADSLFIYLFDSCSEPILAAALDKLAALARAGSDITIVYLNGTWIRLMQTAPWLREFHRGETIDESTGSFMPYAVFRSGE